MGQDGQELKGREDLLFSVEEFSGDEHRGGGLIAEMSEVPTALPTRLATGYADMSSRGCIWGVLNG